MPRSLTVLLLTAVVCVATGPPSRAQESRYDPLTELYEATYLTIHEMEAVLPHGSLYVEDGVLASFTGVEQRTAGVIAGDIELTMDDLPRGQGVLNLFAKIDPDSRVVVRQATQAFYSVAATASSEVTSGYPTAVRSWQELDDAEQEQFKSIYLQAYSDGWIEDGSSTGGGGEDSHWANGGRTGTATGVRPRYPVGQETYAAVWTTDGNRWDYRINADASEFTVTDYYRNIVYVQQPWAPEKGDLDSAVQYSSIHYNYGFYPTAGEDDADAGQLSAGIEAHFTVSEPRQRLALVSYPWVKFTSVTDELTNELHYQRGGTGYSDWMLFVDGDFQPGTDYELRMTADCKVPRTYAGVGYGGVYRFDTAALWPGEDHPCDIAIELGIDTNGWTILASEGGDVNYYQMGGPEGGYGPLRDEAEASWPGTTRNQMLVATKFPSQLIPTSWGELQVFAPADLAEGVGGMESIESLGDIIAYFSDRWGNRGVTTQPVFLIPEESGVQAFEDAGLVFILGGNRGGIPLIAHETAHLWWGYDVSGPRWFFEGMANYGAAKFLEYYYGPDGPAAGQDDPLFYRRYLMNFSLGYELPLSFDERDELDDTAAVYHNSAAFLLTMDALTQPDGIDGILAALHASAAGQPLLSSDELRTAFDDGSSGQLGPVWDSYAVRGEIPTVDTDDDTYRRLEWTPARETYVKMLRWLVPSMKKEAQGDIAGALYCAYQAQKYRNEPKDRLRIAELLVKDGQLDAAWEMAAAQLENPETDDKTRVQANWTLSKVYRARGDQDSEVEALQYVIDHAAEVDLLYMEQQARARLAEITGEATDADSGATP